MNGQTKQNKPYVVPRNAVVKTEASPFLLHEGDFLRLTKLHSFISIWAHGLFAGTVVFLVTLAARFIDHRYFQGSAITSFEWITLAILVAFVVILELLHLCLPTEKKKAIKKIRKHFDTTNI